MYKISTYFKIKCGKMSYVILQLILRGYYIPFSSLGLQWMKLCPSIGGGLLHTPVITEK